MKLKLFFDPSKAIARRITETFDFVWPTAAAIWNLRWQVQGLVSALPDVTDEELLGRFVQGSGIRGANLRRACIDNSWENQQQQFSKFLLFEFCALYESWCELITLHLSLPTNFQKSMQFPSGTNANGNPQGICVVLAYAAQNPSPDMTNSIHNALSSNGKYSPAHLEELLKCYRYFKELRNALIHGSGSALQGLAQAEQDYAALTAASLGLKQRPEYVALQAGVPPMLSLRGVTGFGEVVLKLVCTLDIELAKTTFAATDFIARWKKCHGNQAVPLSNNESSRTWRVVLLTQRIGLPKPKVTSTFTQWLRSNGLVFF